MATKRRARTTKQRTDVERRVQHRLRELRQASGRTVEGVSEAAELSWDALQNIELGKRTPTINSLVKLAHALGTTAADLIAEPEPVVSAEVRALTRLLDGQTPKVRRAVVKLAHLFVATVAEGE